tara:strand:+ start:4163 stop:6379 length:2217 start_codon:yes stop_codon:yes gene_type:complete
MSFQARMIYTLTDEAPALATHSLLPIIRSFLGEANIQIEKRDISLAGRIISNFPEKLTTEQKINNDLYELGQLVELPDSNIIKLPNISASIPQLKSAILELQSQGYDIPDYPEKIKNENDKNIEIRYQKILGSAVNPVLRRGNSDRRVAKAVKDYAKKNPHKLGEWEKSSKTEVVHMTDGDFFSSEKSELIKNTDDLKIKMIDEDGACHILKEKIEVKVADIIDAAKIDIKKLKAFFDKEIKSASKEDVLLSIHLKATMMKVSDPIIFGHAVKSFYSDIFEKYAITLDELGVNEKNGIGDLYTKIKDLSEDKKKAIISDIESLYEERPPLAMVDSDKGITNLHVPSNVIIDASMPAAIKSSGKMWGSDGRLKDTRAIIPDRCYARIYSEIINYCKRNGAFDVSKMGNVSNVGLMANKAQEYGSHDKTFEIPFNGNIQICTSSDEVLINHEVQKGDIWRMCHTQDEAIRNWIELAIKRAQITGVDTIFWLDDERAHDKILISKVKKFMKTTEDISIQILSPHLAMRKTLDLIKNGKDSVSVTGNVLRDYLTDLFPILELGTSAKMLSIVPLLSGGGLYETGAGGSAPKHVEQFINEGHLRWDSLGEFLAIQVSLEEMARKTKNKKAKIIADALDKANSMILENNKSPSRKVGEPDNRHSHFYLALYWAKVLSSSEDLSIKEKFKDAYNKLMENEKKINDELNSNQGERIEIGGYYHPNAELVESAMRPSETFNEIINSL